ncbi:hypothetical protein BHE74_00045772 [Ensete ventricosum]|nr:hypothetical protein BHE74_00045772 [Ensete ventricosum]
MDDNSTMAMPPLSSTSLNSMISHLDVAPMTTWPSTSNNLTVNDIAGLGLPVYIFKIKMLLNFISSTASEGEIFVLLGANGSGKSNPRKLHCVGEQGPITLNSEKLKGGSLR